MAYEARHLRRFKCRYNSANVDNAITVQFVKAGAKITPSTAKIEIYKPGTSTAVLSSTSMTVSGTLCTYAITTTTTANYPVGTGYRAHCIAYNSATPAVILCEMDVLFDVVKMVPFGRIGRDQLVEMDHRIVGMAHNADEDFSEIIESCRDEMQFDLETQATKDGQILEDMILDENRAAMVARFLVLSRIFREHGESDIGDYYEEQYKTKLRQLLTGVKYDTDQDLEENAEQGEWQPIRLVF